MKNLNKMKIAGDMQFEIGQDKVSHFPSMDVKDDETLLNKLLDMKRSTFDLSKFTVVGSPTITDDGIATMSKTDTTRMNYIQNTFDLSSLKDKNYVFKIRFYNTLYSFSDINYNILSIGLNKLAGIFYAPSSKKLTFCYSNGDANNFSGDKYYNFILDNNNFNYIDCVYTYTASTGTYTFSYQSDNNMQGTYSVTGTATDKNLYNINVSNTFYRIGAAYNGRDSIFPIDLKSFSITVDGEEVFSGNKTGIDIIKSDNYEVVGSPTITDDGVASRFSTGNYVYTPNELNIQNSLKVQCRLTFQPQTGNESMIWCYNLNYYLAIFEKNILFKYPIGTLSSPTSAFFSVPISQLSLKEGDWVDVTAEATTDKINVIINGVAFETTPTNLLFDYLINQLKKEHKWLLGQANAFPDKYVYGGSIDLNSFKIYVDGNLVYQPCLKIPYTESKTGSKIVNAIYRDRVIDLYEQYGYTHYYTLSDTDFTLATCKGSDVVESGENYEQTADLTLKQWGSTTNSQTVNLLPYKDTNYAVTLANSSKTKNSFVANATGDYLAVGKTVLG